MTFQLYKTENGIICKGTTYYFDDVDSHVMTPQEAKHLTRGANSKNKLGLTYKENSKMPWTITVNALNVSREVLDIINNCYDTEERLDVFCVDSDTGANKMARNCLVTKVTSQETVSDGEDTYNVAMSFESFDVKPY